MDTAAEDSVKKPLNENIPGGLAEGFDPHEFDINEVINGIKIELEHTPDPLVAAEIAFDHLVEDKEYYHKLKDMEKLPKEPMKQSAIRVYLDNAQPMYSVIVELGEGDSKQSIVTVLSEHFGQVVRPLQHMNKIEVDVQASSPEDATREVAEVVHSFKGEVLSVKASGHPWTKEQAKKMWAAFGGTLESATQKASIFTKDPEGFARGLYAKAHGEHFPRKQADIAEPFNESERKVLHVFKMESTPGEDLFKAFKRALNATGYIVPQDYAYKLYDRMLPLVSDMNKVRKYKEKYRKEHAEAPEPLNWDWEEQAAEERHPGAESSLNPFYMENETPEVKEALLKAGEDANDWTPPPSNRRSPDIEDIKRVLSTPRDMSGKSPEEVAGLLALVFIGYIAKPTGISPEVYNAAAEAFNNDRSGKIEGETEAIRKAIAPLMTKESYLKTAKEFDPKAIPLKLIHQYQKLPMIFKVGTDQAEGYIDSILYDEFDLPKEVTIVLNASDAGRLKTGETQKITVNPNMANLSDLGIVNFVKQTTAAVEDPCGGEFCAPGCTCGEDSDCACRHKVSSVSKGAELTHELEVQMIDFLMEFNKSLSSFEGASGRGRNGMSARERVDAWRSALLGKGFPPGDVEELIANLAGRGPSTEYKRTGASRDVAEKVLGKLVFSYVRHRPGHKDSKGNAAPWVIESHEDGHVVGSYSSQAEAEKALRRMKAFSMRIASTLVKSAEMITLLDLVPGDKFQVDPGPGSYAMEVYQHVSRDDKRVTLAKDRVGKLIELDSEMQVRPVKGAGK